MQVIGLVVLSRTFSPNIEDELGKKKWGINSETNQTGKDGPEHLILASKYGGHIQARDCSKHNGVDPDPQLHHHIPLHDLKLRLDCGTRSAGWPSLVLIKALASAQCRCQIHESSVKLELLYHLNSGYWVHSVEL